MLMSNTITHNEKLKELENQFCLTEGVSDIFA